jgi:hypothetical protein
MGCTACARKGIYKIFLLVVLVICGYWILLLGANGSEAKTVYADPLNKIVFNFPWIENCCSSWPLTHFILFFIIGVLFPECDFTALAGGIAWELFEVFSHKMASWNRQSIRRTGSGSDKVEYSQNWWAGSSKDILFNFAGFYTGKLLVTLLGKRGKICIHELGNCEKTDNSTTC